jgi:hypothetical protein
MPGHTAVIAESHPEHVACSIVGTTKDYDGDFANGKRACSYVVDSTLYSPKSLHKDSCDSQSQPHRTSPLPFLSLSPRCLAQNYSPSEGTK